jgi:hypothetical protein
MVGWWTGKYPKGSDRTIPAITLGWSEKSVRIAGVSTENRTEHFRNTSLEHYRYANLLGPTLLPVYLYVRWIFTEERVFSVVVKWLTILLCSLSYSRLSNKFIYFIHIYIYITVLYATFIFWFMYIWTQYASAIYGGHFQQYMSPALFWITRLYSL